MGDVVDEDGGRPFVQVQAASGSSADDPYVATPCTADCFDDSAWAEAAVDVGDCQRPQLGCSVAAFVVRAGTDLVIEDESLASSVRTTMVLDVTDSHPFVLGSSGADRHMFAACAHTLGPEVLNCQSFPNDTPDADWDRTDRLVLGSSLTFIIIININ